MTTAEKITRLKQDFDAVFEAGKLAGGGSDGYEEGLNAARKIFWNGIQNGGNRTDYQNAFRFWANADTYWQPIYDIEPTNASMMFYGCDFGEASLPDLCEKAGITLSFAKASVFNETFSYCDCADVGTIDTTGANSLSSLLMYSGVRKAHLILKGDGSQGFASTFTGATKLTELTFMGVIGQNGFNVEDCPLTYDSLRNIAYGVQNKSADTSGTSWVLTLGAENLAKLTDVDKAIATGMGWTLV